MSNSHQASTGIAGAVIGLGAVAALIWAGVGDEPSRNAKALQWAGISGGIIMSVVDLWRSTRLGWLIERIPRRARIVVPVALSGIAGILSSVAGGMSVPEAILIGLFAGPTAVFAHEAVAEALLGQAGPKEGAADTAPVPITEPASHRQAA